MEDSKNTTDALLLVKLRNEFYKKKFHLMLGVFTLSLVIIVVLAATLIFLMKNTTRPLYFVADPLGRFIQEPPLSAPNMSLDEVKAWTKEAVENAYSYDFVNFRGQLQNAQKYFSPPAWGEYMKALTISDNLLALQQRKWIFISKVVDTPIANTGLIGGALSWRFEIPMIVTYLKPPMFDDKTKTSNAYVVTVIVQRQKLLESYKGLSIIFMALSVPVETTKKLVVPSR